MEDLEENLQSEEADLCNQPAVRREVDPVDIPIVGDLRLGSAPLQPRNTHFGPADLPAEIDEPLNLRTRVALCGGEDEDAPVRWIVEQINFGFRGDVCIWNNRAAPLPAAPPCFSTSPDGRCSRVEEYCDFVQGLVDDGAPQVEACAL